MAQKAYIYIDSEGEARVYPPVVVLGPGDNWEIKNTTDEAYALFIETGVLGEAQADPETIEAIAIKKKRSVTLCGKKNGVFFYSAVGAISKKNAKGNSDPVIIIEM